MIDLFACALFIIVGVLIIRYRKRYIKFIKQKFFIPILHMFRIETVWMDKIDTILAICLYIFGSLMILISMLVSFTLIPLSQLIKSNTIKHLIKDKTTRLCGLVAFTDQEFDDETALHYMNARYYDADLKKLVSVVSQDKKPVRAFCIRHVGALFFQAKERNNISICRTILF